jgi:serine/threonine-protein kinase HipA
MTDQQVDVLVRLAGEDALAGRLWSHRRRGAESATFAYASDYLQRPGAYALDPALPLVEGQQQTPDGRPMFGAFTDCAPDRWGRRLIVRAEQRRSRRGGGDRGFGEVDFLLGVRDDLRQGALRFRDTETGDFLADERSGVPTLVALPRLLTAADRLDREEADEDDLEALLRGGSSLGGARPKAHVRLDSGHPAIAKFPSAERDEWDVMRWEAVALQLAAAAGIRVPAHQLLEVGGRAVLALERFDRDGTERIGYVSAMTMLEAGDGDARSYLDIVDVIETSSPAATADLHEHWRRIAFSILISNTDDHLRNHGFLRSSTAGWSLAPAFDLNPDPAPGTKHLSTAIDFDTTEARLDTLLAVAGYFRLADAEARAALAEVIAATATWREVASRNGLNRAAVDRMAPAFEHERLASPLG